MRKAHVLGGGVAALGGAGALAYAFCMPQLGEAATGDRLDRIFASPNFSGGKAQNLVETKMASAGEMLPVMGEYMKDGNREPEVEIPVQRPDAEALLPQGEGLRVTWMGHSTMLIEIDGQLLLTDPVFSERASPFQWAGPRRFHPTPLSIEELPPVDAVLISHDHYDHLDHHSIQALSAQGRRFLVPLGVGAHLESWGVPAIQITELDWWEEVEIGRLRLVSTPARHFSGRGLFDRDQTLWTSWAIIGPSHRAWFSGDTGPFPQATEIGQRLGPFDLTLIEVGAWNAAWGNIHLGPDAAAEMHRQVQGRVWMPVHWGTFNLALHAWDQPIVRVQELAEELDIPLLAPVAGQTMAASEPAVAAFWQERRSLGIAAR